MKPDEDLQPIAEKIEQKTSAGEPIILSQPSPDELQPPLNQPAETSSQQTSPSDASTDNASTQDSKTDKANDESPPKVAGFDPISILEAPIKPPEAVEPEGKKATKNPWVMFLVAVGILLFLIGVLLVIVVSGVLGFIVALLGAVSIIFGVFAPIK